MSELRGDEVAALVELLGRCEPDYLPREVFEAVGRITVYSSVELIGLRRHEDSLQVYLVKRPGDDPTYAPSSWSVPGTVLRPTDKGIDHALERLYQDELGMAPKNPAAFVGPLFLQSRRGAGLGLQYMLPLDGEEPTLGEFFSVDTLPEYLSEAELQIIHNCAAAYAAQGAPATT